MCVSACICVYLCIRIIYLTLIGCTFAESLFRFQKATVKGDVFGSEFVGTYRGCDTSNGCTKDGDSITYNDPTFTSLLVSGYCCTGDLCNAAGALFPSLFVLLVAALMLKMWSHQHETICVVYVVSYHAFYCTGMYLWYRRYTNKTNLA